MSWNGVLMLVGLSGVALWAVSKMVDAILDDSDEANY